MLNINKPSLIFKKLFTCVCNVHAIVLCTNVVHSTAQKITVLIMFTLIAQTKIQLNNNIIPTVKQNRKKQRKFITINI